MSAGGGEVTMMTIGIMLSTMTILLTAMSTMITLLCPALASMVV